LLLYRCDSIIVTGADVNWRIKKIRTRLDTRVSIAQVVFVRASHIDAGNATAIPREQRRNIANPFSSSGKPCTRNRPFVRSGKTVMERMNGGERHCATPRGSVVPRMLGPVSGQKHPAFSESDCAIKLDKVIVILPFEIAGGAHNQYRPTFSRIKIRRRSEHGHGIRRHNVSALTG
jgi:hypothetical protein